ncbi:MAG: IS630 family transposase [Clostridia bacterium]
MLTTTSPQPGRKGRPVAPLTLTAEERATLETWARRRQTGQALALRARIVLRCAEGVSNQAVAAELGISRPMVGKWRQRFVTDRLQGLADAPRSGAPRRITDAQVEAIITKTLEETPTDATHWSTRSMARTLGMSQTAVSRIWRAYGLQPHRTESFKLSKDPFFVDKVRDVVGLYLNPPERAVVLCVDEKTQIQAVNRMQPSFPLLPGTPEHRSRDDLRYATTSLFAALTLATGEVVGSPRKRHRAQEFQQFLEQLDVAVPPDLAVHLLFDNYATHKSPPILRWLVRHPRFVLHVIPTGSAWLNLVERWFAELTTKKLQRSAHRSVPLLEADIRAWLATWNENPRPYVWVKTADQILAALKRSCE